ncbi:hypothetical protein [Pseudomonas entomophila]|nr:hypothetical protein [Pseudomonas entomophila]WMW04857.1 hypothetical protein RAH46_21400 [Pseudomonas entomophila]
MKQARTLLLGMLGLAASSLSSAWAVDVTLSARYMGDAAGQFENTTPRADFCGRWPVMCTKDTVDLPISFLKTTSKRAADPRDRLFVRLPPRRTVTVVNQSTLDSYPVTLEFQEFSLELQRTRGTADVPIFDLEGGCAIRISNSLNFGAYGRFLWSVNDPRDPQPCYSDSVRGEDEDQVESEVGLAGTTYSLIMPRPIGMPQGTYRGSTQFTVGADADFAFGNNVSGLNDRVLTVHLDLDVRHDLYLRFPPGSDRAVLEPPGGWQAYLGGRGVPSRLERDLPFRIWSSGPFKVYKRCEFDMGAHCGIRNPMHHAVPVEVSLSLPSNVQHGGGAARHVPLSTGATGAPVFNPQHLLFDQPGQLHFQVRQAGVGEMVVHAGTTYQGQVTVVFDAEL